VTSSVFSSITSCCIPQNQFKLIKSVSEHAALAEKASPKQISAAMTYVGLFRVSPRWFSSGAVSAFKSDKLQSGFVKNEDTELQDDQVNAKGPFLSQDGMWRVNPGSTVSGMSNVLQINATLPGLQSHYQLMQAQPQTPNALSSPTNLSIASSLRLGPFLSATTRMLSQLSAGKLRFHTSKRTIHLLEKTSATSNLQGTWRHSFRQAPFTLALPAETVTGVVAE